MNTTTNDSEAERRRKVAEEKLWGGIIEAIERMRKQPIARSIGLRLGILLLSIDQFEKTVKAMGTSVDPLKTKAPSFTIEQTNFLIRTYNSIIEDLHSHFGERDSYVASFSPYKELDEPTLNDVAQILFMMGMNILQILSYMVRWTE